MKRIVVTSMVIALIATLLTSSQASDRSVEGLIIGGGTGAIVGHAIGQNAHSTIAGAVVGGTVGIIIGSAMDNHHREVRRHSRQVFSYSGAKYRPHRPKVYREIIHHYNHRGPVYNHKYKEKRHRKGRPVFSNHYKDGRRHHNKQPGRKRHNNRF